MGRQGVARGRYVFANNGVPTGRGLQGIHILRDGAGCQIWKPTWKGTRTIVRPLPVRNPENPEEWDPFRLSDDPNGFGDWIRRYDMAFSIGTPGITFITQDPRDRELDAQQNPVWLLYRAIPAAVRAAQAPQSWGPLVVGSQGRPLPLSAPKDGYVMQAIVVEHNSKPIVPPAGAQAQDQPVVFLMSQTAGEALLSKLQERDANGNYRYPDLTNPDAGAFIQFHQAGSQRQAAPGGGQLGAAPSLGQATQLENRYEVEILSDYNGVPPAIPHLKQMLAERSARAMWDDILHIPTIDEQVRRLCHCGLPASAVVYALQEAYGDKLPPEVLAAAHNEQARTSVPVQQAPLPQAGGQPAVLGGPAPVQPTPAQPADAPQALGGAPVTTAPASPVAGGLGAPTGQTPPPMPDMGAATVVAEPAQSAPAAVAPAQSAPAAVAPAAVAPAATAQTAAAPAAQPGLGQTVATPPGGPPETPFDPPPEHVANAQASAMAAIERARERAHSVK